MDIQQNMQRFEAAMQEAFDYTPERNPFTEIVPHAEEAYQSGRDCDRFMGWCVAMQKLDAKHVGTVRYLPGDYVLTVDWEGNAPKVGTKLYEGPQALDESTERGELHEAAREFFNLTHADSSVIIRAPSAGKRDAIIAAGQRLRAALATAPTMSEAVRDVLAERRRQVEVEGFAPTRDDGYIDGQLAQAGAAYALAVADHTNRAINSGAAFYARSPDIWPWSEKWWKPTSPRRALVKAGALILAEIERIDRAAAKGKRA